MHASFKIAVQIFIRIKLWRIGWQKENLDLIFMIVNPCLENFAVMNTQIIQNQIYLAIGIFDQSFQELDKQLRIHSIFVNHSKS